MAGKKLSEVEGVDSGEIGDLVTAGGSRGDDSGINGQGFDRPNQRFCHPV